MVFLNECLPNKAEESLTAGEPKAVSGCQRSASIRHDSDIVISCFRGAQLLLHGIFSN
jgi:hypothetical protein